jgi:hypothetical protein
LLGNVVSDVRTFALTIGEVAGFVVPDAAAGDRPAQTF